MSKSIIPGVVSWYTTYAKKDPLGRQIEPKGIKLKCKDEEQAQKVMLRLSCFGALMGTEGWYPPALRAKQHRYVEVPIIGPDHPNYNRWKEVEKALAKLKQTK